jgi:hypothetical protein
MKGIAAIPMSMVRIGDDQLMQGGAGVQVQKATGFSLSETPEGPGKFALFRHAASFPSASRRAWLALAAAMLRFFF